MVSWFCPEAPVDLYTVFPEPENKRENRCRDLRLFRIFQVKKMTPKTPVVSWCLFGGTCLPLLRVPRAGKPRLACVRAILIKFELVYFLPLYILYILHILHIKYTACILLLFLMICDLQSPEIPKTLFAIRFDEFCHLHMFN